MSETKAQNTETKNFSPRTYTGEVVSSAGDKTAVIRVRNTVEHPLYKKYITKTKKYHAHDEKNEARVGDWVEIHESRPLSKLKHTVLSRILRKAKL